MSLANNHRSVAQQSTSGARHSVDVWLKERFVKRECVVIIPTSKDSKKCGCGRYLASHYYFEEEDDRVNNDGVASKWSIAKCTATYPTDAYGTLTFHGVLGQNKARYVRLDFHSDPLDIWYLLVEVWGLEPPKLVITVHGGGNDFDMSPSLLRAFKKGLLKAAKTTSVWIITSGVRLGVVKHVAAALSEASGRNKLKHASLIGFAPWGLIRRGEDLTGLNENRPYYPVTSGGGESGTVKSSRFVSLCEGHTCFLLVDNGTVGRPCAESFLRRRFEEFLREQPLRDVGVTPSAAGNTGHLMPMVCLVVNGGRSAIHSVMNYVSIPPLVPVVVCSGTGGAADLIAFAYHHMKDTEKNIDNSKCERLLEQIHQTLGVTDAEAKRLLKTLLSSVRRKQLISISGSGSSSHQQENQRYPHRSHNFANVHRASTTGNSRRTTLLGETSMEEAQIRKGAEEFQPRTTRTQEDELDLAMLNALLKGRRTSPVEKLNLLLTWNREDMARQMFENGGHDWSVGSLDQAMMNALIYDRVDFVRLLLSHGMAVDRFLTIGRLEELYNSDKGPPNTLRFVLQDVVKDPGIDYKYRLPHIGLVIDKLIGFGFRSNYCRQEFRKRYKNLTLQRRISTREMSPMPADHAKTQAERKRLNTMPSVNLINRATPHFAYPFNDLFLWAVLTNRQEMALCFWQHGEEPLAKALMGYSLYKSLAKEAEEDYLEVEICQQLKKNAGEFKALASELVEQCYQSDDDLTLQLLTYELRQWGKRNCVSLAAMAKYKKFIAHPCCQMLLADLWLGGLRIRKNVNLKVVIGVLLPPSVLILPYKSKEELLLQAQTAEEFEENRHIANRDVNNWSSSDESVSSSTSSSSSSSPNSDVEDGATERFSSRTGRKKSAKRRRHSPERESELDSGNIVSAADEQHPTLGSPVKSNRRRDSRKVSVVSQIQLTSFHADDFSPLQETVIGMNSPLMDEYKGFTPASSQQQSPEGGGNRKVTERVDIQVQDTATVIDGHSIDHKSIRSPHLRIPEHLTAIRFSPLPAFKRPNPLGAARKLQSMTILQRPAASLEMPPKLAPMKQRQPLNAKKKMQEFYSAPISTFFSFAIGYLVFLSTFTYIVLVKTPPEPSWPELYVIAFIFTFGIDHARKILIQEPKFFWSKVKVFTYHRWDVCTLLACVMFFVALFFRVSPETIEAGRVMYCVNIVFWYMRMLHLLTVSSKLGPFINMYGKMVLQMILLINILFVVLVSFGVFRQSIVEPNRDWSWDLLRNVVYKPYFMLYGELYAEEIDKCGDEGRKYDNVTGQEVHCVPGFWLTPLFMTIYLLLSIVVFLNMMIAAFNYVFMEVNSQAQEIWKFQRYEQVIEYEQQPFIPPPFVICAHVYLFGKYLYRRLWKRQKSYRFEHSLKLFLSSVEISKLHDFERECLEEMLAKKQERKAASVDEQMRYLSERVDYLVSSLDDLHDRTNGNQFSLMMLERNLLASKQRVEPAGRTSFVAPDGMIRSMSADSFVVSKTAAEQQTQSGADGRSSLISPLSAPTPTNRTLHDDTEDTDHRSTFGSFPRDSTRGSDLRHRAISQAGRASHLSPESPGASLSRRGSLTRNETWPSGLTDFATDDTLLASEHAGSTVRFTQGTDGDDEDDEDYKS